MRGIKYDKDKLIKLGKDVGNIGAEKWGRREDLPSLKAIKNHFGSWNKFMQVCGFETRGKVSTNDEIIALGKKKGYCSREEWENSEDYPSTVTICRKFGSWGRFMESCGYPNKRHNAKHWQNFENVESTLEIITRDLGHFPTHQEVIGLGGYGGLAMAVTKYHGGYNSVRQKMGVEIKKRSNCFCENQENFELLKSEIQEIANKLEHFPSQKDLVNLKRQDLIWGIKKKGGFRKLRDILGFEQIRNPNGYWNKKEIEKRLEQITQDIQKFPTEGDLNSLNNGDLLSAIRRNGGLSFFRQKMGYTSKQRARNYWSDLEKIKREIEPITNTLGHFPTAEELEKMNRSDLLSAICRHHGGLTKIKEFLGFEETRKAFSYWNNFEKIQYELERITEKLGRFPTKIDLRNQDRLDILRVLDRHGGYLGVRERLGYGNSIPPELEQEFAFNVESDSQALTILRAFSDNPKDAADILMALNPERFKNNTYRILSLGSYLGKFGTLQAGIPPNPDEILISLEDILDKNELVRNVILRKAFRAYEQRYIQEGVAVLKELEEKVAGAEGNIKSVYQEILRDFKELAGYEIPGIKKM